VEKLDAFRFQHGCNERERIVWERADNARLRCAVFGTLDTTVTISMQDFFGDVFYLMSSAKFIFQFSDQRASC